MPSRETAIVAIPGRDGSGLAAVLAQLGYDVHCACGVAGAASLLANLSHPLLFTGVAFGDGNWRDLLEKAGLSNANAPVFLCTDESTAELWWDALEYGVREIVTPPYTLITLAAILGR